MTKILNRKSSKARSKSWYSKINFLGYPLVSWACSWTAYQWGICQKYPSLIHELWSQLNLFSEHFLLANRSAICGSRPSSRNQRMSFEMNFWIQRFCSRFTTFYYFDRGLLVNHESRESKILKIALHCFVVSLPKGREGCLNIQKQHYIIYERLLGNLLHIFYYLVEMNVGSVKK